MKLTFYVFFFVCFFVICRFYVRLDYCSALLTGLLTCAIKWSRTQ